MHVANTSPTAVHYNIQTDAPVNLQTHRCLSALQLRSTDAVGCRCSSESWCRMRRGWWLSEGKKKTARTSVGNTYSLTSEEARSLHQALLSIRIWVAVINKLKGSQFPLQAHRGAVCCFAFISVSHQGKSSSLWWVTVQLVIHYGWE